MEPSWILPGDDRFTVNKVAAVDAKNLEAEPADARMALDESVDTEHVRDLEAIYIPRCVGPALITGVRLPHEAWSILRKDANKIWLLEACTPLWDWLMVRLLTDYVSDLDHQLTHLLAPPQSAALMEKRVLLF